MVILDTSAERRAMSPKRKSAFSRGVCCLHVRPLFPPRSSEAGLESPFAASQDLTLKDDEDHLDRAAGLLQRA